MKYEAVFGDQSLFDGAPEEATHATKGCGFYKIENMSAKYVSDGIFNGTEVLSVGGNLIAERRIIADPKRWTVADQKAGRLPEVGAKYMGRDVILECVLADKNGDVWGKSDEGLMHCHSSLDINPIETPEEKERREENEFVKSEMENTTLSVQWSCVYERGLRAAYRKLKGGE